MPEPKLGEGKQDFLDRCIPIVIEDGTAEDEKQAVAICSSMYDQAHKSEPSETLIHYGQAVKALGDGKVGGYLVRFSTKDDPDLEGDYFDDQTDFVFAFPGKSAAWFNHSMDASLKRLSSDAELKMDEVGVWAETILDERNKYEKFLLDLAEKGKLGWSSGTASHLIEKKEIEGASYITRWPLGLDASLTHIPAEPRNTVIPLKVMSDKLPSFEEFGDEPEADEAAAHDKTESDVVENDNDYFIVRRSKSWKKTKPQRKLRLKIKKPLK